MSDELDDIVQFAETLARRFMRPRFMKLADALEVVTSIDRTDLEAALASARWNWLCTPQQNGIEYTARSADGSMGSHWLRSPRDRVVDPCEAFELLASRGVIPDDWVGSSARRFASGARAVAPASLRGVVAMAAAVDSVLECERLAKELVTRLAPFGVKSAGAVVWRVDREGVSGTVVPSVASVEGGVPGGAALEAVVEAAALRDWVEPGGLTQKSPRVRPNKAAELFLERVQSQGYFDPRYVANALRAHQSWIARQRSGSFATVLERSGLEDTLVPKRIALSSLLNPFEPLLLIFARGFAVADVARKSVHLVALSTFDEHWTVTQRRYL
jgi:hypothetical protein